MEEINKKYLPSPAYDQAIVHPASGNKVNKYGIGQAVLFSPFFFLGHAYAQCTGTYPADGYSRPYQFAIWFGGFLFAVLGLILLRRILLNYFEDSIVAWTLLTISLGTTYLEHASINNAMNHAWLFTLLCALIFSCIKFYEKAGWTSVFGIGISLGLSVLTRPTEIIWVLIPLLWGITSMKDRISFLKAHWQKTLIAVLICGLIISIQMVYWKFVADEWIIYTYRDQKLDWFHPRIWQGLVGVNNGWWAYTPIMVFAMTGWPGLYRLYKSIFWPVFITSVLAIYITLCWKYFGDGLGQRNLIQMYPLMAFPLGISISWMVKQKIGQWIGAGLFMLNVYYNLWWIHQAHRGGGFLQAGQMNTLYFFKVAGRLHPNKDYLKLLDTREYYDGEPTSTHPVHIDTINVDTTGGTILLTGSHQFSEPFRLIFPPGDYKWLRVEADITVQAREWDIWKYTQWFVQFYRDETPFKVNSIRLQRLVHNDHIPTHIFFDVKIPREEFSKCEVSFWNAESTGILLVENLKAVCF